MEVLSEILVWFFILYAKLGVVGFFLILLRNDKVKIFEEAVFFLRRPFPVFLISILLIYIILPLSIPFTIAELIRQE